jgi:hypothetical protein
LQKKNSEENFVLYVYLLLYYMAVSLFIATPLLLRPRPRPTAAAPAQRDRLCLAKPQFILKYFSGSMRRRTCHFGARTFMSGRTVSRFRSLARNPNNPTSYACYWGCHPVPRPSLLIICRNRFAM